MNMDEEKVDIFEIKRNDKKINLQALYVKAEAFLTQNPKLRKFHLNCCGLSLNEL